MSTGSNSLLGEVTMRIPVAGRIRPGVVILTKAAAAAEGVSSAFESALNKGLKGAEIDNAIKAETGFTRKATIPKNVPYFTVRPGDFVNPKTASQIMEKYGEVREEFSRERQLYSFPIVLPTDDWLMSLPHSLKCFSARGIEYMAQYDAQGVRRCMHLTAPESVPRAKRVFGARVYALRPENDGKCEPNLCQQYQAGECKLNGSMRCYVFGIPGMAMIEIPTTSFYSLSGARDTLAMLKMVRGSIAGLQNGKPLLWVSKRRETISRFDHEKRMYVQEKQWLIRLDTPEFDIATLVAEREHAVDTRPRLVAAVTQPAEPKTNGSAEASITLEAEVRREPEVAGGAVVSSSAQGGDAEPPMEQDPSKLMERLVELLKLGAVPSEAAKEYATATYGFGWSRDVGRLSEFVDSLEEHRDEPSNIARIIRGEEIPV